MGLLGGSKSSTSNLTENTTNTFNNVDNRVGSDDGIIGGNSTLNLSESSVDGTINLTNTDYGAIQGGISTTLAALDTIEETNAVANQQTMQAIDRSFALAGEATKSEAAGALQDFMKWGALVLLGGGALYLLINRSN